MTHEEIRKLSVDSRFNQILEVSITKTASAVMNENTTSYQQTGLDKRHNTAIQVINDLQNMRAKFSILIANTDGVNSLITIDEDGDFVWPSSTSVIANLDAQFDNACSANFNIIAGLTYTEMQPQI